MTEASQYANGGIIIAMLGLCTVFIGGVGFEGGAVNRNFAAEGTAMILFGLALLLCAIGLSLPDLEEKD